MPDYGNPATTPADACRVLGEQYAYAAKSRRAEAAKLEREASAYDEAARMAEKDADMYDRWQPTTESAGGA